MNHATSTGGLGFLGALAVLFIALKLTGYIDWSWWWVLAPLWGGPAIFAALALLGLTGYLTWHACKIWQEKQADKRRRKRRGY